MNLAMAGIDPQPFVLRLVNQDLQQLLPHALVTPADKSAVGMAPVAVIRWQIPPRRACAPDLKNRIDKRTIIPCDTSPTALAAWQMRLQQGPYFV